MTADSTIQQVLDGGARWCVHHGDMLDALPLIPDNSVDAICCDAPYGLGEEPDIAMLMRAWLDDTDAKAGKAGFMGRKWDVVPGPRYWRECFRILKPGGYLLTFSGTRTQDLMGMAIRLAGFEIRDSVAWLHSEGMAKSTNIERKIAMHQCTLPGRHYASTLPKPHKRRPGDHLCPETEESVKWKGQGSALAPSHEPIIVARKPIDGTYAESTLRWGTTMNIDATRVAHAGEDDLETHQQHVANIKRRGHMDGNWKTAQDLTKANEVSLLGRWPKNVVLEHSSILWCALSDSITEEEERIVYDYFGIREAVRALREDDLRYAVQDQETEVLFEGVRWCRACGEEKWDQEDRVGITDVQTLREGVRCTEGLGEERSPKILLKGVPQGVLVCGCEAEPSTHNETLSGVAEVDVREQNSQGDGEPSCMEGRTRPEAGVRLCDDCAVVGGAANAGKHDDDERVHPGAQNRDGSTPRKATPERRSRSPQKWEERRQQTGELAAGDARKPLEGSQDSGEGVEGAACRGEETPKRKPRIEVASQAIPWWLTRLFVPVARTGCRRIGTTIVAANPTWDTPNRATEPSSFTGARVSKVRHGREGEASAERRYTGSGSTSFAATPGARRDAVEDVEQWECVDGCPVKLLAEQSGTRKNGGQNATSDRTVRGVCYGEKTQGKPTSWAGEAGTAARCFQQLGSSEFDEPFRYQAKPSRREKDRGLQHFRRRSAAEATNSNDDDERLNNARTGAGRTGGARNPHPTTKGVELLRWMVRLVARPGQLVCVPFAGSGSECIAALLEGCSVIGIEWLDTDDEPFVSVARARLEHIDGREFVPRESLQPKREAEKPRQGFLF